MPRRLLLPPLFERLAVGQPVITCEQALSLSQQVLKLTSAPVVSVTITHTVKSIMQFGADKVQSTNDGDSLKITLHTEFGENKGEIYIDTNQLDEPALRQLVARTEAIAKDMVWLSEELHVRQWDEQDTYPVAPIWYDTTSEVLHTAHEAIMPEIGTTLHRNNCSASGFVGILAKADAILTDKGITAYSKETDCEVSITARPADGKTTGWSGHATRDWTAVNAVQMTTEAAEMCNRNQNPRALEPGRRTAILGPAAVVQLMRFFSLHFDGGRSDLGLTGFSKIPGQKKGSRWKERLFDPRVKITTDPRDPDASFKPWFANGLVSHPTTWVENRELGYLAYGRGALFHQLEYAEMPYGFRLHGGETTLEQMIAQCDEGVYVNRFSNVDTIDWYTGLITGVTRDGCFLVRKGKIERPVKNFRFLTSPFFFLNHLITMGPSHRAAYGYAPWTEEEKRRAGVDASFEWPRRPMVVPPLMIEDFNFSALVDAV